MALQQVLFNKGKNLKIHANIPEHIDSSTHSSHIPEVPHVHSFQNPNPYFNQNIILTLILKKGDIGILLNGYLIYTTWSLLKKPITILCDLIRNNTFWFVGYWLLSLTSCAALLISRGASKIHPQVSSLLQSERKRRKEFNLNTSHSFNT